MYLCKQSSVGMGIGVSSLNKSPVHSYLCVGVFNGSAPGSAIKKRPEMCVCVCTHVRSRVGMGVCVCL